MGSGSSVAASMAIKPSRLPWRRNRAAAGNTTDTEPEGIPAPGSVEPENISPTTSNVPPSPNVPVLEVMIPTPQPFRPNMNSLLLISPRQEAALLSSVPYTPTTSIGAHTFKYYCPLCMEYFEGIFKSKCCGNYTCLGCTKDFLAAKGFEADSASIILANIPTYKDHVPCPHCFTNGFHPIVVNTEEEIRDYKGTNHNMKLTISPRHATTISSNNNLDGIAYGRQSHTPLKIGDTFEDLKRKMIPFAVNQKTMSNDTSFHDKENVKQYENSSPGVRISPRIPSPYNSSSSMLSTTVGTSSSRDGSVSQGIAAMCSPDEGISSQSHVLMMGEIGTHGSVHTSHINTAGPGTNSISTSTGRRTIRLGLTQSTTTSVPPSSSSPSPLLQHHSSSSNHSSSASACNSPHSSRGNGNGTINYVNNHLIGRNLFDDVSAEEMRRDRDDPRGQRLGGTEMERGVNAVNTQPQSTSQHPPSLSQSQQPSPSHPSLVMNSNNQIDSTSSELPPLGYSTTMRPPLHTQPTFSHSYHNITPRSRIQLNHTASLMVEEIIGNAVEREQRQGMNTWRDLHSEQQEHLERMAPLC